MLSLLTQQFGFCVEISTHKHTSKKRGLSSSTMLGIATIDLLNFIHHIAMFDLVM